MLKDSPKFSILKLKLEELGMDCDEISMPGQYNHLLCPMVCCSSTYYSLFTFSCLFISSNFCCLGFY